MKNIFKTVCLTLLFMSLSAKGHCGSLLEYPKYIKWYNQQVAAMKATFECIVPPEERAQWRFYDHNTIIPKNNGEIGEIVECFWLPPNDSNFLIFNGEDRNWPNRIVIRFMPISLITDYREKKQSDGDAFQSSIKDVYSALSSRKINRTITPIDDDNKIMSVEIERIENERDDTHLVNGETVKEIALFRIQGDRIISLSYELRPKRDPEQDESWNDTRDLWLGRFEDVQFD